MKDFIEQSIDLAAPVDRVWTALTDHKAFGAWFQVNLTNPFKIGEVTQGVFTLTGHEGVTFWARVQTMNAPHQFSFVWPMDEETQPDAPDIEHKTTLVQFFLTPIPMGTRLMVKESGFENLPETKKLQIFRDNQEGWAFQTNNIKQYLSQ